MDAAPPLTGRILVADDDAAIRAAYARVLEHAGHQVQVAEDGATAAALAAEPFDAIVSDIWMPGLSGTELLKRVRARDPDVPVILVTGSPELESAMAAVEYGALIYLRKPVPLRQLLDTVQDALRLHSEARLKRQAVTRVRQLDTQKGERAEVEAGFQRALDKLWMARQPIVRWSSKSVSAFECLLRSDDTTLSGALAILGAAESLNQVHVLGRRARDCAALGFGAPEPEVPCLFVNLHPQDLMDDALYSPEASLSAFSKRVVLEVTERAGLDGMPDVQARIGRLRAMGFRIALDDLGAGYAGLTTFTQLEPDVVKLDMALVRDVDKRPTQRKMIQLMIALCRDLGIDVVAEGVETPAERDALVGLGCDLLQGYLFAKPARALPTVNW